MKFDTAHSEIGILAKCLLASPSDRIGAMNAAKMIDAPLRVGRMIQKSAIAASSLGDGDSGDVLADWRISSAGFFGSLRTRSIFFRMLDGGFRKVPLNTRVGIVGTNATGYIQQRGNALPISRLALAGAGLEPVTAAAILVVTDEVARSMTDEATNLVNAELRGAVSDVVDAEFWNLMIDSGTPSTVSAGNDQDGMRSDLAFLLESVNTKGVGPLFWVMSPDLANRVTVMQMPNGAMSGTGGEFLNWPALVGSTMPAGTLRLVNAGAIAANADPIVLDASNEAALEMETDPSGSSDAPTPTELISMFQTDSTALLAKVAFGVRRLRTNAVAEVTGIEWGTPVS
ncbi:phage major capsid protein [Consotaella salsifontis]|nr:phage major capsid protein [Consotaella salsifontis]